MSRTIRRPERHLLTCWLPELNVLTASTDDWRRRRLPGLLHSPYKSDVVRKVQTDNHRFFHSPESFQRNRWHRKFRQQTRLAIHHAIRDDEDRELPLNPDLYYPYMF